MNIVQYFNWLYYDYANTSNLHCCLAKSPVMGHWTYGKLTVIYLTIFIMIVFYGSILSFYCLFNFTPSHLNKIRLHPCIPELILQIYYYYYIYMNIAF